MNKIANKQSGFTIVELMIATSVFSVVLLLCTTGLLQITKVYYKGVTATRTQEASRIIMDEISRSIQFSGGKVTIPPTPATYFCIGSDRYTYVLGYRLAEKDNVNPPDTSDDSRHVLVKDTDTACASPYGAMNDTSNITLPVGKKELMIPGMRLAKLSVENDPAGSVLYRITIRVVSGSRFELNSSKDNCDGNSGNSFCAVSELSTTVQKRIQ